MVYDPYTIELQRAVGDKLSERITELKRALGEPPEKRELAVERFLEAVDPKVNSSPSSEHRKEMKIRILLGHTGLLTAREHRALANEIVNIAGRVLTHKVFNALFDPQYSQCFDLLGVEAAIRILRNNPHILDNPNTVNQIDDASSNLFTYPGRVPLKAAFAEFSGELGGEKAIKRIEALIILGEPAAVDALDKVLRRKKAHMFGTSAALFTSLEPQLREKGVWGLGIPAVRSTMNDQNVLDTSELLRIAKTKMKEGNRIVRERYGKVARAVMASALGQQR